jgi:hypothetical protein
MNANILRENKKISVSIKKAAAGVPTYYLSGEEAEDLDRLVEEGLKEYREGRTKKIGSLADLEE